MKYLCTGRRLGGSGGEGGGPPSSGKSVQPEFIPTSNSAIIQVPNIKLTKKISPFVRFVRRRSASIRFLIVVASGCAVVATGARRRDATQCENIKVSASNDRTKTQSQKLNTLRAALAGAFWFKWLGFRYSGFANRGSLGVEFEGWVAAEK